MNSLSRVYRALYASVAFKAETGERIFLGRIPRGSNGASGRPQVPYVVLKEVVETPVSTLKGPAKTGRGLVQVDFYGDDLGQLKRMQTAARLALEIFATEVESDVDSEDEVDLDKISTDWSVWSPLARA